MTRIFYDTEFLEDGKTINLISIGMIREDTGAELYLVNRDMPIRRIRKHRWLMENVVRYLPQPHGDHRLTMPKRWLFDYTDPTVKRPARIADEVAAFIQATPDPQLWAWYGAYDHVALAWLFGPMINLPDGIPMWTNDLRQEAERLGNSTLPEQTSGEHNALADARHNLVRARALDAVAAPAGEQATPVDWQATVRQRERELKTAGEARHRAEQRLAAALDVIHEWQREGEPNGYLTRVHRALVPPTSGNSAPAAGGQPHA